MKPVSLSYVSTSTVTENNISKIITAGFTVAWGQDEGNGVLEKPYDDYGQLRVDRVHN